jgi:hypothetical protein
MDDPNIEWGDPLVIEAWAQIWRDLPLSGGLIGNGNNLSDNSGSVDGSSDSLSTGTREQCIATHALACDYDFKVCLAGATGLAITVLAACTLATALLGLVLCSVGGVLVGWIGDYACLQAGKSCMLRAPDGCPQ